MDEKRIYLTTSGKELTLVDYIKYDNIRYLFLCDEENEVFKIAYENDKKLIFINEEDDIYNSIASKLYEKINKTNNE